MNYGKMIRYGFVALITGISPAAIAADGDSATEAQPTPPAHQQKMGQRPMRPMMGQRQGLVPRGPMSKEDSAKFSDLNDKLKAAQEDFRKDGSDANKAKLKETLSNLLDASQAFEVDRCEKALARAKARAGEKDAVVERMLKHMTESPKERKGERGPKGERAQRGERGPKGERGSKVEKAPADAQ